MNNIIVTYVLLAVATAYVIKRHANLEKIREECVEELNITTEEVIHYMNWNFTEAGKTPCYMKCVLIKMELFDDEKGFLVSFN